MFAQVVQLSYWKSEHTRETCQDASGYDVAQGLFAVADGVGTAILSDLWSDILVKHFLAVPLLSNDPFEVEWWLGHAQERFKELAPQPDTLPWNAQRKAYTHGSASTLATLRISNVLSPRAVQAEFLAFGDSCIIIANMVKRQIQSFPLEKASDFTVVPISLPSRAGAFRRDFHVGLTASRLLEPDDVVILATDAVAQWLLGFDDASSSSGSSARFERIDTFLREALENWEGFITRLREERQIVDDDSTALIITLRPSRQRRGDSQRYQKLGKTERHNNTIRQGRWREYQQAKCDENLVRLAVIVGDATDFPRRRFHLSKDDIQHARNVADAMSEMLVALRQAVATSDPQAYLVPIWRRYQQVLCKEPCARNLLQSLSSLGVA